MRPAAVADPAGASLSTGAWLSERRLVLLHVIVAAILIAPVAFAQYPPLTDYANHIARVHVLANLDRDPLLAERYVANWSVVPNLALDAILVPLAKLLPVTALGRAFVVACMMIFIAGGVTLCRAFHGRVTPWSFGVYAFAYAHLLAWGFLNCYVGLGLAFFACAGWYWTRERRGFLRRAIVFSIAAVLLYFAHIVALGFFALFVAGLELERIWQRRDRPIREHVASLAGSAAPFAVPIVLWAASATPGAGAGIEYNGLAGQLQNIASATLFHRQPVGAAVFAFVVGVIAVGIVTRALELRRGLIGPFALLAIGTLAMPTIVMNAWGDYRLPPALAVFSVAATRFTPTRRLVRDLVIVLATGLLAYRAATVWDITVRFDRHVGELRESLQRHLPRGARLMVAQEEPHVRRTAGISFPQAYWHLGAFAVIDRAAFVPTLFTDVEKQPLTTTPAYRALDVQSGDPMSPALLRKLADGAFAARFAKRRDHFNRPYYAAFWPRKYEYVLHIHFVEEPNPSPRYLRAVTRGSFFTLYKVWPPPPAPGVR